MLTAPLLSPHGPASPFGTVQPAPKGGISLPTSTARDALGWSKLAGGAERDRAVGGRC